MTEAEIERDARCICILLEMDPDDPVGEYAKPLWTFYRENAVRALEFKERLFAWWDKQQQHREG